MKFPYLNKASNIDVCPIMRSEVTTPPVDLMTVNQFNNSV